MSLMLLMSLPRGRTRVKVVVKAVNLDTKALAIMVNATKVLATLTSSRKWEPSRPKHDQSRTNTNQTATVAQVNHIRETAVAEAREEWEREQYDKDREERLESLQLKLKSTIWLLPNS